MTDRNETGRYAQHSDSFTEHIQAVPEDGEYSHRLRYSGDVDVTRGQATSVESPAETTAENTHRAQLAVLFGEGNKDEVESGSDQATLFDETVLDLAETAFEAVAMSPERLPVENRYVTALLLHDAWAMNSRPRLVRHLQAQESIAQRIGFESIPDQSMFARKGTELKDAGYRDSLEAAANHIVFAACRNGIDIPAEVEEAYGLDLSPEIADPHSEATKHYELLDWVETVFKEILDPITFDRASNRSFTTEQIIATIALAALGSGPDSAYSNGSWRFDPDEIPSHSHVSELIRDLDLDEIMAMFTQVNRQFIQYASELGFFDRASDFAVDTTWIEWDGEAEPEMKLIENPKVGKTGKGWCFSGVTVIDPEARFSLGLNLVRRKDLRIEQFRRLLRMASQEIEIGRVHSDREFFSEKAVRTFRTIAGTNWVIRAKRLEKGEVQAAIDDAVEGESYDHPDVAFANLNRTVGVYAHPLQDKHKAASGNTHMAFLSDLPKEDIDLRSIHYRYAKRWNIETYLRQVKHRFAPETESPSPKIRLFNLNVGSVFFNLHTLINRATSQLGFILDVPFYDVLNAIVEATFTRKEATEP